MGGRDEEGMQKGEVEEEGGRIEERKGEVGGKGWVGGRVVEEKDEEDEGKGRGGGRAGDMGLRDR